MYCIQKFQRLLALAFAALLLGGCMNHAETPKSKTDSSSSASIMASLAASAVSESDWYCPYSPNVTLSNNVSYNGGYDFSGNHSFTVCTNRSNQRRFLVKGLTSSKTVCLYPMYATSGGSLSIAESPRCFSITGAPIDVTFANAINYMIVVDSNYTNALNQCLSSQTSCPPHSSGNIQ